jgi:hypothetical protein
LSHPQEYPFGPGTAAQKALDEDRAATQARWEQSLQPGLTGVVAGKPGAGPQPYFTSAKTQGTNTQFKQRRLEMFTGALDADVSQTGTYRNKREIPAMFRPEQSAARVGSGGFARSSPVGLDAVAGRYVPSKLQNHVLPTQQTRVGPGVGAGIDVQATDGFHPMMRIMPQDFGWKKNNLPGGFVPGAALVGMQSSACTTPWRARGLRVTRLRVTRLRVHPPLSHTRNSRRV